MDIGEVVQGPSESASTDWASSTRDRLDLGRAKVDLGLRGLASGSTICIRSVSGKLSSKDTFRGAAVNVADMAGDIPWLTRRRHRFDTLGMVF